MKSSIEPLEGNKVKISVTIEAEEFEPSIDAAWKTIAKEVRIPGFRPGKVPRKVLEQRVEPAYARSEAIQKAVPEFYFAAVRENDVDAIAQPELDITSGEEEGDVSFDAVVEVRPEIELSGYQGLSITIPSPHPADEDIADQIDRLRGQYGELVTVERPAASGDFVTIDIAGSQNGEAADGLTADDYSYEVGSGTIVPELDDQLRGLKAGESVEFVANHPQPDEPRIDFTVTVKEVKEKVLPDLDDAWISDATEFSSVDEFRDDVIERLTKVRKAQASMAVQSKLGDALAELVEVEVPESLLGSEMRARLENLVGRLQQQGLSLETYLQVTGTEPATFSEDLRNDSHVAIKVDLALRAVTRQEGLVPSDDEVDDEVHKVAEQVGMDVERVRRELEAADQISAIRSDLGRRNALRWLTERIEILDESGLPVDRALLDLDPDDDDDHAGHDHDHDHDHEGHDHDHDH
ncbi:MAG: trigger factor [Acidimicrobiales bacterium]